MASKIPRILVYVINREGNLQQMPFIKCIFEEMLPTNSEILRVQCGCFLHKESLILHPLLKNLSDESKKIVITSGLINDIQRKSQNTILAVSMLIYIWFVLVIFFQWLASPVLSYLQFNIR